MPSTESPSTIVSFWRDAGPDRWFEKSDAFDTQVRSRFLRTHDAAVAGQFKDWENTAEGALALLILLDQFPRNMFRGEARTFATDPLAREIAARAIDRKFDQAVDPKLRGFFYLPFMHSEDLADQERCVTLYRAAGDEYGLKFALDHEDIIRRFGRFPHRNPVLGRATTAEEQAFLDRGGFKG